MGIRFKQPAFTPFNMSFAASVLSLILRVTERDQIPAFELQKIKTCQFRALTTKMRRGMRKQ